MRLPQLWPPPLAIVRNQCASGCQLEHFGNPFSELYSEVEETNGKKENGQKKKGRGGGRARI